MKTGIWQRETVALVLIACALPVAVAWLWDSGLAGVLRLIAVLVISGIWHLIFMLARAQPPSLWGAFSGLLIAMLLPDLGPGQMILTISFGVVVAELAFGGWGRNVLNPVTLVLAFAGFGYPAAAWPDLGVTLGWGAMAAAALGVFWGVLPWRVLAGAALVAAALWLSGGLPGPKVMTAALVVGTLIVAEPVTSAATSAGRWLNGALFAGLVALFARHWADAAPLQLVVSAALLAALAAPLFDEIALALRAAQSRRRHG